MLFNFGACCYDKLLKALFEKKNMLLKTAKIDSHSFIELLNDVLCTLYINTWFYKGFLKANTL